ncbi:MAG: hypothetical protein A3J79_04370 [Elusimicrobia bacterium RIFOXYB2_FULL_62_6]|nr:MAG: hypothetical protein A3J79_04370 [Elusimicrobia bacterium RIFOXYB2_FULL_62_6]
MIKIKRDSGYADLFRGYKVIIDGKVAARIQNGQTISLEAPKGKHMLYLKLDWCRSNVLEFEVGERDVFFECGSPLRGWNFLLSALYSTIYYRKYIWLKQVMSVGPAPAPSAGPQ